ncbi:MAG: hypothetical protein DRI74_08940 [Bacteroidetes bacterium]|nr:MAG: hypothetical protein DRI74_08940 [Bacteroidota bacterium]
MSKNIVFNILYKQLKANHKLWLLVFILGIFNSCKNNMEEQIDVPPKVQVQTTHLSKGYLPDYIELTGKTIYLNKSSLAAPISGYVTNVTVRQGDEVLKDQLLFEMQTPEAFLMQKKDKESNVYGSVKIYAPEKGRLISLNVVNKGVYVDKGVIMSTLLATNDLKLQINLPFEYNRWFKMGKKCDVELPDNTYITAVLSKVLPQIDETSQTIKVLADINTKQFIPENMIVKVLLDKSDKHKGQILPKQCLQTDALMSQFWVMRLLNDSIAVRTFVEVGNQSHQQVEIISPIFELNDYFISEGAYGLGDTVLVEILKN